MPTVLCESSENGELGVLTKDGRSSGEGDREEIEDPEGKG
jgi:hypothetical protein